MFSHETFNQTETNFNHIYLGVVEDNNDPDKAGKVQIRIAGIHTPKKTQTNTEGIPTEELPWALPMMPIAAGGVSGLGYNGVPVQGDWVALFFIGGNHNNPVYFGTIKSKPVTPVDSETGFNDPAGKYPLETEKPDWNKEARYDGSEELKSLKDGNLETFEPASPAEPVYPNNTVFETPDDGVIVEYDSTPTKERWHVFHKASKSYIEIAPNGDMVMKSTNNRFEITTNDRKIFVKNDDTQQVDGNRDIDLNGNETTDIAGTMLEHVVGTVTENYDAAQAITVGGTKTENVTGAVTENYDAKHTETVGGNLEINVTGTTTINSTGKVTIVGDEVENDGGGGAIAGNVTGNCMCIFGVPHPDISGTVKSSR